MLQVLPHVNALLERAVSVFKATTTTNTTPQPLEKRETIYPGQTNALQCLHFKQTAKQFIHGRKKSGLVLK